MIMNEHAEILQVASVPYPSYSPNSGWYQQNPEDWIQASIQAISKAQTAIGEEEIGVVSLSGHMSGLVLVDDDGQPLYPCITLSDTRSHLQSEWLRQKAQATIYRSTGNPAIDAFLLPKLLWMKENYPAIYQQTRYILFPKDYLRFHLTGRFATDATDAGNSLIYDMTKQCWDESLLYDLNLRKNILPEIFKPYEVAGQVSSKAARLFGIKAGIPVVAGAADMAAQAVGYGINEAGQIAVAIGTSATILTVVPEINPIGRDQVTFHPHVIPGLVYALGSHFSGGMSLNWFSGLISGDQSKPDYALIQSLAKEAAEVPSGSGGLLYLPFLSGSGTPYFDAYARGSFLGLGVRTNRATMFHAVLEGISYNLKETILLFEKMGIQMKTIRAGGGGMNIELWPSILAAIFGYPIDVIGISDASTIGAAVIGGFGAGIFPDLNAPVKQIVGNKRTVIPNEKTLPVYDKCFELYQKSYQNLKDISRELVSISSQDS
jgi:Sugar (pentulose and hexulose) kinases